MAGHGRAGQGVSIVLDVPPMTAGEGLGTDGAAKFCMK
jgi:hypothetical protein